jgi:hypothetical protein
MFSNRFFCTSNSTGNRYWRIIGTTPSWTPYSGHAYFNLLYTISFYNAINCTGTDLCIGKSTIASSEWVGTDPATNANDNNSGTFWASGNDSNSDSPQWWGVDMGINTVVHSVSLNTYGASYQSTSYSLQYSNNNINWFTQSVFACGSDTNAVLQFNNL